jgi:hypothetical protein
MRFRKMPFNALIDKIPMLRQQLNNILCCLHMFNPAIRRLSLALIGFSALTLVLGIILYQAAYTTGAASNYEIAVSWGSAIGSVIWPPTRLPFILLPAVLLLTAFTIVLFFRAPRYVGVIALLLLAAAAYLFDYVWIGWFLIIQEFDYYHFNMDAEKLGENWFTHESAAVWTIAIAALAILRLFARKRIAVQKS